MILPALLTVLSVQSPALDVSRHRPVPPPPPVRILPNDNLHPAGRFTGDTLRLTVEARLGRWEPDGGRRKHPLVIAAFGIPGQGLTVPGPMLRVRAGTRIRLRLINHLPGLPLVVHGLDTRPAAADQPVRVAPGATRALEFDAVEPGTYYYWGATTDTTTIEGRDGVDSQLSGAFIVDPADGPLRPDRVFVLGVLFFAADTLGTVRLPERFAVAINGRSWPSTERFDLAVGDTVRWRWINPTVDNHPMHLHGFYYRVDARGDGNVDTTYLPAQRRLVVTERLEPGTTMDMTWAPDRPGQWLFHCHIHAHISPDASWDLQSASPHVHPGNDGGMEDMAGLVLGIRVRPGDGPAASPSPARRRLRLDIGPMILRPDGPQIHLEVTGDQGPVPDLGTPGPPIMLRRGEPAEILVVNRLEEPTAIHWHGIELESYYDGVPAWSGGSGALAPLIAPGDSFAARMTPPRAGTFIYHAHYLVTQQVGDGLVGPLLVVEPEERVDPADELTWIVGGRDIFETGRLLINGSARPLPLRVVAGHRYRVRLINITESNTGDVALLDGDTPVGWRLLAKDAIPVSPDRAMPRPARVRTSVGETWDFEWIPARPADLRLEVRNQGNLVAQQAVEVR
ncbi:MAG: multicopper oxidase domain-containing protein [Gemmatimonadales bacterium]